MSLVSSFAACSVQHCATTHHYIMTPSAPLAVAALLVDITVLARPPRLLFELSLRRWANYITNHCLCIAVTSIRQPLTKGQSAWVR